MKDLIFTLTVEETNKVLAAIGKQPFDQVFEVISKIQSQASEQMRSEEQKKTLEKVK